MSRHRTIALALLVLDVVSTVTVFNLIAFFRGLPLHDELMLFALAAPVTATVFAVYLIDGYKARTDMISVDYTSQHAIALVTVMLAILLLTYAFITSNYALQSSRAVIMLSFLALIPLTLAYRRSIYLRTLKFRGEHCLVFLGDRDSRILFQTECQKMNFGQKVVFCATETDPLPLGDPAREGSSRRFQDILDDIQQGRLAVEAIVLRETARELPPEVSRRLVELYFAGVPTYTLELFHQVYWQKIPLYRLNQTWLFQDGFQIAREPVFERLKRSSDIAFSLIGLVVSAPVMAVCGLAIWLEDRGPIFFTQTRIGKNHAPFRVFKLRTMRSTASTALYTQQNDNRITRIGKMLRSTRLDEFPQMWNVLVGDMSLIGPRAEWSRLVEDYEREIPCYHFRHLVKPGITGWAQVNYPYGASVEDTIRKLEYDLFYVRHFSFLLDATIVLKTIHVMLFGRGR